MRNTVLNLLQQADMEPTMENIVGLDYFGLDVDTEDGEFLGSLEELFEECVAEEEKRPKPSGMTWELGMVVRPQDIRKARVRNRRYPKRTSKILG